MSKGMRLLVVAVVAVVAGAAFEAAQGCTAFCLRNEETALLAKNHDWHLGDALVIVNPRGVTKRAMLLGPGERPAVWVSRYGSVTFNQYGKEFCSGGINEAGLALDTLWLDGTQYPGPNDRDRVMSWMQYQLDTAATVAQVIAGATQVEISNTMPMLGHVLLCDRTGAAAVIEYLEGKMVVHTGEELPVAVLANDVYASELEFLEQYQGFGGEEAPPQRTYGRERIAAVADAVKQFERGGEKDPVAYGFASLARVQAGTWTKWMIVYDCMAREVHWRTLATPAIKTIRLETCDFTGQGQMINANLRQEGDVTGSLLPYEPDVNRWMVHYTFEQTPMLKSIPAAALEAVARYGEHPERFLIEKWELAGPFWVEGLNCEALFDTDFGPESDAQVQWRAVLGMPFSGEVNLAVCAGGGENRVAYLRSQVDSPLAGAGSLEVASDDGVKVWLNGQQVYAKNVLRGIGPGETVPVQFRQGQNELMLKVTQGTGAWAARLGVQLPQGK